MRIKRAGLLFIVAILFGSSCLTAAATELGSGVPQPQIAWKMAAGLSVVLLLIYVLAWAVKRSKWLPAWSQQNERRLSLLESMPLSNQKASLLLVKLDSTELLISVTATQINTLHIVDSKQYSGANTTAGDTSMNGLSPRQGAAASAINADASPFAQQLTQLLRAK